METYFITRFDRNRHGGGIAFYIKSYLFTKVVLNCPYNLEFALLSLVNPSFSLDLLYFSLQEANVQSSKYG